MTWKSVFSGIALSAILGAFLFAEVSAQDRVRIRKSATGVVRSDNRQIRREPQSRVESSDSEFQIHYLVNNERRRQRLGDLYWDEELARMARAFSRQMARESFFSHYDRSGNSVVERARQSGIRDWRKIGENLFFCEGYDSFDALAVRGWMKSAEHRRNILDNQFNTTGIGVAQTRDGRIYITQVFVRK